MTRVQYLTILFLLFSLKAFSSPYTKMPKSFLVTVYTDNIQESYRDLFLHDFDIMGVNRNDGEIDLLIDAVEYDLLRDKGYRVDILSTKGVSKGPDQQYKNPEEIKAFVDEITARFPQLTKLISIGKSVDGRDIWAVKISDNPELDEDEPTVLFNSLHHAREVMTPEVAIDIIEYLTTNYDDPKVRQWVDNAEIWVIPMVNPDGNDMVWTQDNWWRKNTRGGYGVDLNRNYPEGWNSCNGSSGWRSSQTYRGPSPASEPETQAMMNFVEQIRPVFDISYHSYSELVIYPKGCRPNRSHNAAVVEAIGDKIGELLQYQSGTAWDLLYNADGGDIDWMHEEYNVIPFVIELNSRSEGFQPDYDRWRDETVEKNRAGWQYLLDRLFASGVRGKVERGDSDVIDVYDAQDDFVVTYKLQGSSDFHIVLDPGSYKLVYGDQIMEVLIDDSLQVSSNWR